MTGKFIGYFRLIDGCTQTGCPVCRVVEEDGRRHLDAIMYEQADAETATERDLFEHEKLELRLKELTMQLNEAMSRAAALHYRLSRVAEDRDALELNLSGERGANELAMRTITDLRAENERLRAELDAARREAGWKTS